jgi:protein transport protein SEC61 subunit gamma-like protein
MEESKAQQAEQKQEEKPKEQKIQKEKGPSIFGRLKNRLLNYKRVIDVAKKPTKDEFVSSAKITGSGIILIGVIGFIIFLIYFLVT